MIIIIIMYTNGFSFIIIVNGRDTATKTEYTEVRENRYESTG